MSARQFRILTLNIAHGRGLSTYQGFYGTRGIERNLLRIARLLLREQADIVALQEVDRGVGRTDRRDLIKELSELTGMS